MFSIMYLDYSILYLLDMNMSMAARWFDATVFNLMYVDRHCSVLHQYQLQKIHPVAVLLLHA